MKFGVTDSAADRILAMQANGELSPCGGLRISVRGGGCSGLTYSIDWYPGALEGDQTYENGGVRVYVDRKSALFLGGSELVYETSLMTSGFKIKNPNAKSTCGCGESFSV